jgi:hypothetical protein
MLSVCKILLSVLQYTVIEMEGDKECLPLLPGTCISYVLVLEYSSTMYAPNLNGVAIVRLSYQVVVLSVVLLLPKIVVVH